MATVTLMVLFAVLTAFPWGVRVHHKLVARQLFAILQGVGCEQKLKSKCVDAAAAIARATGIG
jgi:hypothetical protein